MTKHRLVQYDTQGPIICFTTDSLLAHLHAIDKLTPIAEPFDAAVFGHREYDSINHVTQHFSYLRFDMISCDFCRGIPTSCFWFALHIICCV